jgi:hypothetical protein
MRPNDYLCLFWLSKRSSGARKKTNTRTPSLSQDNYLGNFHFSFSIFFLKWWIIRKNFKVRFLTNNLLLDWKFILYKLFIQFKKNENHLLYHWVPSKLTVLNKNWKQLTYTVWMRLFWNNFFFLSEEHIDIRGQSRVVWKIL